MLTALLGGCSPSNDEGNATTEGLKLKITVDGEGLIEGAEGTVSVTKGIAARIRILVTYIVCLQSKNPLGDVVCLGGSLAGS